MNRFEPEEHESYRIECVTTMFITFRTFQTKRHSNQHGQLACGAAGMQERGFGMAICSRLPGSLDLPQSLGPSSSLSPGMVKTNPCSLVKDKVKDVRWSRMLTQAMPFYGLRIVGLWVAEGT